MTRPSINQSNKQSISQSVQRKRVSDSRSGFRFSQILVGPGEPIRRRVKPAARPDPRGGDKETERPKASRWVPQDELTRVELVPDPVRPARLWNKLREVPGQRAGCCSGSVRRGGVRWVWVVSIYTETINVQFNPFASDSVWMWQVRFRFYTRLKKKKSPSNFKLN